MNLEKFFRRKEAVPDEAEERGEIYLSDLGLNWKYLRGKKILDIGAGRAGFAEAAKRRGVEVCSLESFDAEVWQTGEAKLLRRRTSFVGGKAEGLPFADASFDLVISHAAPPIIMSETKEQVKAVMEEAKRVLKEGRDFVSAPAT